MTVTRSGSMPPVEEPAHVHIPEAVRDKRYSVVIPVFESARIVGETIDEIVDYFTGCGLEFEVICVNDGSSDDSWTVIAEKAREYDNVVALNLLRNYGQHYANLAAMSDASGDYVVTMDDDGQNPPDQAVQLIIAAVTGNHDVVFGKFEQKQATGLRRVGSKMIGAINRRVFGQPDDLTVSNFRVLRRDVVDRIVASRTAYPYITGQALIYSRNRANLVVRHEPRRGGGPSTYSLARILRLVLTILFSYSVFPLRLAALLGFGVAVVSLCTGAGYLINGLLTEAVVPGWTTIVVLLSIFNGVTIALLSMVGEYVVRTLNTVSVNDTYHVVDRAR